jgi:hypothetical protein
MPLEWPTALAELLALTCQLTRKRPRKAAPAFFAEPGQSLASTSLNST